MENVMKTAPAVFAAGETYQIMVPVNCETVMWVKVGDKCYYDESNGILRSSVTVHRMTVPAKELEKAKKYTICYREMIERKAYFSESSDVCEVEFDFCPVSGEKITAYHIADAHNMVQQPVAAAKAFETEYGKIDFLILNGDIPDHSGSAENFDNVYEIVAQITGGKIPTVFARGNHDTRGLFAEKFEDYTPCVNGKTYYTVRLGKLWAVLLDCGEDKPDTNVEYGNTICCHAFRECETEFLEKLTEIENGEHNTENILYKAVIVHMPFTKKNKSPFDIEEDTYTYWSKLLREKIKPDIMICGHTHKLAIHMPGSEADAFGQPCPIVEGSAPDLKEKHFAGAGFIFDKNKIEVVFNNSDEILEKNEIVLGGKA